MMNQNTESRLVLAGFLGIGQPGKGAYQNTRYLFEGQEAPLDEVQLFSVALQKHLQRIGRTPRLWLVLGTEKSIWEALGEVAKDSPEDPDFTAQMEALKQKPVNQTQLDRWGEALKAKTGLHTVCCLVESSGKEQGQNQIWEVLERYIKGGDDVMFDITNGLRHQPVIASYSVMLLRWLRNVGRIDFCYGVLGVEGEPGEAVFLPLCEDLTKACEAVATQHFTGSFGRVGQVLFESMGESGKKAARLTRAVAFTDETNHPKRSDAEALIGQLNELAPQLKTKPVQNALATVLYGALTWLLDHLEHDRQMLAKAKVAKKRGQRFKAIAYLHEAITSAICCRCGATIEEMNDYRFRTPMFKATVDANERDVADTLNKVFWLRNAVMHGTEPTTHHRTIRPLLDDALKKPKEFNEIFDAGVEVCEAIMSGLVEVPPKAIL